MELIPCVRVLTVMSVLAAVSGVKLAVDRKSVSSAALAGQPSDLRRRYLDGVFELSYGCKNSVRLGKKWDGGYVMCEDAKIGGDFGACQFFSYGVRGDDSLEVAIHERYGCHVEEFDPTVSDSPGSKAIRSAIHFHKEGIAGNGPMTVKGLGGVDTLLHHVAKYGRKGEAMMVKVDVEENEWDSLGAVPEEFFDTVNLFVVELHLNITRTAEEVASSFASHVKLVETLRKHFYLYHSHLANCGIANRLDEIPGVGRAPRLVELAFINKRLVTPGSAPFEKHSELDQPCNPKLRNLKREDFE